MNIVWEIIVQDFKTLLVMFKGQLRNFYPIFKQKKFNGFEKALNFFSTRVFENIFRKILPFSLSIILGTVHINKLKAQSHETASTNSYYKGMLFSSDTKTVDSLQSEDLMLEGVKEKIVGNTTLSEDYFSQSLKADPNNDASLYELALIQRGKKDFKKAKEFIVRALTIRPNEPYYLNALLDINSGLNDTEGLLSTYSLLIKLEPSKEDYYFAKADLLINLGRFEEALRLYHTLSGISGEDETVELQKQRFFLSHNKPDSALRSIRYLIKEFPEKTQYYLLLSEILRSKGENNIAWDSLSSAKKRMPRDGLLQLGIFEYYASEAKEKQADSILEIAFQSDELGIDQKVSILDDYYLQKGLGDYRVISKLSNQLVSDYPDDKKVVEINKKVSLKKLNENNKGNSLYRLGDKQVERKTLTNFLENQSGDFRTWNKLILLDFECKDYNAAVKHASSALEFYPNQIVLYWYKADGLKQIKQFDISIQTLKLGLAEASGETKSEALLFSELGEVYQSEDKYELSDSAFNESLKREINPEVLNNFAFYLSLRNSKLTQADSMANQANQLRPQNANFEDTYAWILFKENNFRKSLIWMEKTIKDDKNESSTFFDHYGDILFKNNLIDKAVENWQKALLNGSKNKSLNRKIKNRNLD